MLNNQRVNIESKKWGHKYYEGILEELIATWMMMQANI